MRQRFNCLLIVLLLAVGAAAQSRSIQGVWKLTEQVSGGQTKAMTQPSVYIFTKKHYSIIYVTGDAPRTAIADLSKATADELLSTFVTNFIANAGTYELKGGKLTTRPIVAKSPNLMQPDRWMTSSVTINGNTMTITPENTNSGPVQNPATSKLTRIE